MEYIKKEDLIEGEIYIYNENFINKITKSKQNEIDCYISKIGSNYQKPNITGYSNNNNIIRLATSEEKHWLNCCITADKFITFEEAMKTFIPEYVECINIYGGAKIGTIYKTSNNEEAQKMFSLNWDEVLIYYKNLNIRFKPSTKEAYDAQFVDKEPEFVLPEKWCIKDIPEVKDFFQKYNNSVYTCQNNAYLHYPRVGFVCYFTNIQNDYTEITFEQFKKYVLKEEIIEEKVIEPLPQFKIIETIETITKVENNEGNQFFIGDTVKSLNSNQRGKIIKFKYSNDKSDIIAITTFQQTNGISINKIEHYIEPKVVEPEFVLPERWKVLRNHENYKVINDYFKNRYPNNTPPGLPVGYIGIGEISWKSCGFLNESIITFDQFKKYVLKENQPQVESINRTAVNIAKNSHYGLYPLTPEKCYQSNESLLEKAKRLYPVGTKFKSPNSGAILTIKNHNIQTCASSYTIVFDTIEINTQGDYYGCVHNHKSEWAEIIEYPHGFKVGDRIKIRTTGDLNIYKIINIEGDVLFYHTDNIHYKNHCRVLAKNTIKVN